MARTKVSIRDIIDRANADPFYQFFNYVQLPYPGLVNAEDAFGRVPFANTIRDAIRHTAQGALVIMPLTVRYQDPNEVGLTQFDFPNEPLLQVSGGFTIVRTDIPGRNGTVKEQMGKDDYQITIRGFIINETEDSYPEREIAEMQKMINAGVTMEVESPFLDSFGITHMVVEKFRFIPRAGFIQMQPYELTCWSDDAPTEILTTSRDEQNAAEEARAAEGRADRTQITVSVENAPDNPGNPFVEEEITIDDPPIGN